MKKEMSLRELQLFSLEILKDVHGFCVNSQIKYSLYGGTLLGAIRHNGFIPWDDDIDIIMPRPDYDLFCKTYKSSRFEIVNYDNDESFSFAYTRVCDRKLTWYSSKCPCNRDGMGCWIDVFPADGFPSNEKLIPKFYKRSLNLYRWGSRVRLGLSTFHFNLHGLKGSISCIKTFILIYLMKFFLFSKGWRNPYIKKIIDLCHTYNYGDTPFWGSITSPYNHLVYHNKADFDSCILHNFEDSQFYILNGYDAMLKRVYGNYLELPPIEKRRPPLSDFYTFYWLM